MLRYVTVTPRGPNNPNKNTSSMSEPATKKFKTGTDAPSIQEQDELKLTCEHIHVDTSIYDELISSSNSRFIINNNKWLVINLQYIWEFIPNRAKFIKRSEVPATDQVNRLLQVVSDEDNNQVIFLGISAFYVLNTNDWKWTQFDNKIKAPINAPNYARDSFIFSYNNDGLFRGPLPFNGDLEMIETKQPTDSIKIGFPWINNAIQYLGDYYFIKTIQHVNEPFQQHLVKLCMTKNEFIIIGQLNGLVKGNFIFGFERFNWLYFISDHNTLLIISDFETSDIQFELENLPPNQFLPGSREGRYFPSFQDMTYNYAYDGNNPILFNKNRMTFLKFDLNSREWCQPIIFENYPPPLHDDKAERNWIQWKNFGLLIAHSTNLNTVFLFDTKTWTWTAKQCLADPSSAAKQFGWLHGAVHENFLYVCGQTEHSSLEIHRLDLDKWIWSQIPIFMDQGQPNPSPVFNTYPFQLREAWLEYASMVVAENKLYFLGPNIVRNKYDWVALDLETSQWTKKPSTLPDNAVLAKRAVYSATKNCIYTLLDDHLATLVLPDPKFERSEQWFFYSSATKAIIEWDNRLLFVGSYGEKSRSHTDFTLVDLTINRVCPIIWAGDDPYLYYHNYVAKINDELFTLTETNNITRMFKDEQVKSLQHLATVALCKYLDMDNVFTLFDYAINLRNRVLQQGCITYLKNNTLALMERIDEVNALSPEIKDILAATFTYLPIRQ